MGEYAKRKSDGVEVKIGTCEDMYYIRYEDRLNVSKLPKSLDPHTELNLRWRLPFPDEDHIAIGEYREYERGIKLSKDDDPHAEQLAVDTFSSSIQLTHPSGLLINVVCYHGWRLPDIQGDASCHWNGKSWFLELCQVKNTKDGVKPIVWCRFCREKWCFDWADVMPYVQGDIRDRLLQYQPPSSA